MTNVHQYISEELVKRRTDYLSSPDYLLEHYRIEKQNIEAYNGRQFLEMLQNADDACETGKEKKVLIKLTENELVIANYGEPFTQDGFRSILYSNLSSKTMQKNKIGHKGLGFRSILSWADEVTINSGGTTVSFSEDIAKLFLQELISSSDKVAKIVPEFIKETIGGEFPIATLRVPKLLEVSEDYQSDYTTTITIKLKEDILDEVQTQIFSVINRETLIFLNHIETIEIDSPERKIIYKKSYGGEDKQIVTVESLVYLNSANGGKKTWNVKRKTGAHKGKNFELALAWNDELNDKENVLFSYFKTEAKFRFPALLHGTFELTSNRKYLENDTAGHNKFLTGKLAELLIESSLAIASQSACANFLPLTLLNIDFDKVDSVLTGFNFKETLIEKIRENNVFPSVNGNYFNYAQQPVYYDFPIANILQGDDVKNLMPHCLDVSVVNFLKILTIFDYPVSKFTAIIAGRIGKLNYSDLSKLYYHLLTYQPYIANMKAYDFDIKKQIPFLIDIQDVQIPWNADIFIQPDIFVQSHNNRDFKLPKSLNIKFVNSDLILCLIKEFVGTDIPTVFKKLSVFKIKEYSFGEVSEAVINHYNGKNNISISDVKAMHSCLFQLYKRELKEKEPSSLGFSIKASIISINGTIKKAKETYFGKDYGNPLTEKLYFFDKAKLLASIHEYRFENEKIDLVKKYFSWLGITNLPRYDTITLYHYSEKFSEFTEHILRNFDYKKAIDGKIYKDYTEFQKFSQGFNEIRVGYFDDFKRILAKVKTETIFEWIKNDNRLRKTLEDDVEILSNSTAKLAIKFKRESSYIPCSNLRSYTKWLFATNAWLPIESGSRNCMPDKCCLSKTITNEFSPFVEKPNINIAAISEKLEVSETIIENYLILVGVHREISTFSISALYKMLLSLPTSNRDGNAARKIYREIISNFNEGKIDMHHPDYISFTTTGKIFCQKGTDVGYFPISDSYYIPTKTYGSNVLKLFPLVIIDSKQGSQKIEKLFGVKKLKDISFNIIGEPITNAFNGEFQNEIEGFKALVYVLRMNKDINHDIANRLKKLKIVLSQELQTNFVHYHKSESFELEHYEYINDRKRNQFYISVPSDLTTENQLRDSNKFCQSIAEIFSTIIETEEFSDFIHDLYSKPEFARELRLLSRIEKEDNLDIVEAKKRLNIIDDVRLLFWKAFSIASKQNIKTEIRTIEALNDFLKKKLKLGSEKIDLFSSLETFSQLYELSTQELFYEMFIEFDVDYTSFARHYSGIDFKNVFKNKFEDYKFKYHNDFAFQLFEILSSKAINEKEKYFNVIDDYNSLRYGVEMGFLENPENAFLDIVASEFSITLESKENVFSFDEKINRTLIALTAKSVIVPALLKETIAFQTLLLFNEEEEIIKKIELFNRSNQNTKNNSNTNQIKLRGSTVDYDDYQSLAKKVLEGLNIGKLKLKPGYTLPVEQQENDPSKKHKNKTRNVRFNSKNEEQIGFISELICYHKLIDRYGESNVNWVSENASRAYPEKFITREAGKGYDMELTDGGKVRFIEIKGSSNLGGGIYMSKDEMKIALEFPYIYDLLIVENPLSNEPNIKHIKMPFKFKKEESLFANDKLKVFNDNYLIKFKWNE